MTTIFDAHPDPAPHSLLGALDPEQRQQLHREGSLVCAHPAATAQEPAVLGAALLPCSPDRAWDLALDWERLSELIPAQLRYVALERDHPAQPTQMRIWGRARVGLLSVHYTVAVTLDASRWTQRWTLCGADEVARLARVTPGLKANASLVREIEGRAAFAKNGDATLYTYENLVRPAPGLPRLIEQFLTQRSVRLLLRTMQAALSPL